MSVRLSWISYVCCSCVALFFCQDLSLCELRRELSVLSNGGAEAEDEIAGGAEEADDHDTDEAEDDIAGGADNANTDEAEDDIAGGADAAATGAQASEEGPFFFTTQQKKKKTRTQY